jgi:hypothetical protein
MQTLKQVLNRPAERENLRNIGVCMLAVCGFVFVAFVLVILHTVLMMP